MPTAYALHIGLNKYSLGYYPEGVNRLNYCVNDMLAMQHMARNAGFPENKILSLSDEQATQLNVKIKLLEIKALMQSGDLFLFTFAGHGLQRPDRDGDESIDRLDECICLYDGLMFDDMLSSILMLFPSDSRVVCFFDSCHSGSAIKITNLPQTRGLLLEEQAYLFQVHEREITRDLKEAKLQLLGKFQPATVSFAACRDNEQAAESNGHGHFTRAIIDTLQENKFQNSYGGFFEQVQKKVSGEQHPFIFFPPTSAVQHANFLKNDPFLSFTNS